MLYLPQDLNTRRYTCFDIGFYNPPLMLCSQQNELNFKALNRRGEALLSIIKPLFSNNADFQFKDKNSGHFSLKLKPKKLIFYRGRAKLTTVYFLSNSYLIQFFKMDEAYLGLLWRFWL